MYAQMNSFMMLTNPILETEYIFDVLGWLLLILIVDFDFFFMNLLKLTYSKHLFLVVHPLTL